MTHRNHRILVGAGVLTLVVGLAAMQSCLGHPDDVASGSLTIDETYPMARGPVDGGTGMLEAPSMPAVTVPPAVAGLACGGDRACPAGQWCCPTLRRCVAAGCAGCCPVLDVRGPLPSVDLLPPPPGPPSPELPAPPP